MLEIKHARARIELYPDAWSELATSIRRCLPSRFPYGIVYAYENEDILVLAVAHLHRKPDYWKNRLV